MANFGEDIQLIGHDLALPLGSVLHSLPYEHLAITIIMSGVLPKGKLASAHIKNEAGRHFWTGKLIVYITACRLNVITFQDI